MKEADGVVDLATLSASQRRAMLLFVTTHAVPSDDAHHRTWESLRELGLVERRTDEHFGTTFKGRALVMRLKESDAPQSAQSAPPPAAAAAPPPRPAAAIRPTAPAAAASTVSTISLGAIRRAVAERYEQDLKAIDRLIEIQNEIERRRAESGRQT